MTRYLDLDDFLIICEEVLGHRAEDIAAESRLELAESALAAPAAGFGGVEVYPDLATKAAVLCVRLVKNHPLRRQQARRFRFHDRVPPPQRAHLDAATRG